MSDIKNFLDEVNDVEVEINKDLSRHSTFKLVARGDLITVKTIEALKKVIHLLRRNHIDYIVLGLGANTVLKMNSSRPYIKLNFSYDKKIFDEVRDEYALPASITLNHLTTHALQFSLKGWEVFTGIPATLGGAIFMNAGTSLGEIGEIVKSVTVLRKTGEIEEIKNPKFSYRKNHFLENGDVIISAVLIQKGVDPKISETIKKYLQMRIDTQPLNAKTCGCVFKNNVTKNEIFRAGQLIELVGLKGFVFNQIRVSKKHANFMENLGDATYEDVRKCSKFVSDELYLQYGIHFETEVEF